jgi:hypothetical protein
VPVTSACYRSSTVAPFILLREDVCCPPVLSSCSDAAVRVAGSCDEGMIMAAHEEILRRLALHDEGCIESVLAMDLKHDEAAGLDPKPTPWSGWAPWSRWHPSAGSPA